MQDLFDRDENNLIVHNLHFNFDHNKNEYPMVIVKTTAKIEKDGVESKKWYHLMKYVTQVISGEHIYEPLNSWVLIFEYITEPSSNEWYYMQEYGYKYFFHALCYVRDNPLISIHFQLFISECLQQIMLSRYSARS
jgi:hypothetical protein